jgi:hypothetical protein
VSALIFQPFLRALFQCGGVPPIKLPIIARHVSLHTRAPQLKHETAPSTCHGRVSAMSIVAVHSGAIAKPRKNNATVKPAGPKTSPWTNIAITSPATAKPQLVAISNRCRREPKVCRLAAGGSRIRTLSPSGSNCTTWSSPSPARQRRGGRRVRSFLVVCRPTGALNIAPLVKKLEYRDAVRQRVRREPKTAPVGPATGRARPSLADGCHRLMRLEERANPLDGAGFQLRRLLPGINRDLGIRRQRSDIHGGLVRVCGSVVRQD